MAVSPDDRFSALINSSAERGGWVPGDVFTADTEGEEESVETRRIRFPILVALAVLTVGALVVGFLFLRPPDRQSLPAAGSGTTSTETPSSDGGEAASVVVHVTGEVRDPAVVTLDAGARVQDAVEAAGGLGKNADAETINLARVLEDGEQIHIPAVGEEPQGSTPGADGPSSPGAGDASGANGTNGGEQGSGAGSGTEKVNLNTADSTTLQTLPGVGPVTAESIIATRESQPFTSVEDLLLVQGIGPKTFERLKDLVTV